MSNMHVRKFERPNHSKLFYYSINSMVCLGMENLIDEKKKYPFFIGVKIVTSELAFTYTTSREE